MEIFQVTVASLCIVAFCLDRVVAKPKPHRISQERLDCHGMDPDTFQRTKHKVQMFKAMTDAAIGHKVNPKDQDEFVDDMLYTEEQIDALIEQFKIEQKEKDKKGRGRHYREKRKMMNFVTYPKAKFTQMPIKYGFHEEFLIQWEINVVKEAINIWESKTCIRFVESSQPEVLFVNTGYGCWSYVGKAGSTSDPQFINLRRGCLFGVGKSLHEIGHALGFSHEHSRPDRDEYVTIVEANIQGGKAAQFRKKESDAINSHEVPYDYRSVMQYSSRSFNGNSGQDTIVTKDPRHMKVMGQNKELSFYDIKLANEAYCSDTCTTKLPCPREGYTDPNNCSRCLCPDGVGGTLCDEIAPSSPACNLDTTAITVTETEGYIETPNYATGNIALGTHCNWCLKAPTGMTIEYWFSNVTLHCTDEKGSKYCSEDWIEVRDKTAIHGYRYCCEEELNKVETSASNELIVTLRKYAEIPGKAKMYYKLVPVTNTP